MRGDEPYQLNNRYHLSLNFFNSPICTGDFRIYQVGKLHCSGSIGVPRHAQPNLFELTVVKQGRGRILTNDIGVAVKAGDIYISFPGDWHAIESDAAEPLQYVFLSFSAELPADRAAMEEILRTHAHAKRRLLTNERIGALAEDALAELKQNAEPSAELLNVILRQLVIYLLRELRSAPQSGKPHSVSDAEGLCFRMMRYIDNHIFSMTELRELSDALNYNYSYLSKLFRQVTSGTLSEYHRNRRLETARLLIEENELRITEISEMLHYSGVQAFSRSFRERYGAPPREYRVAFLEGREQPD